MRCYTALVGEGANRVIFLSMLVEISMMITISIDDSFDVYLWHLRGLSMIVRMSIYGSYE